MNWRLQVITIEPPSCSSSLVFIGRNGRGQWVAQEQNGLFGGLFVSRANAVRYALFENGHRPESIIEIAGLIELDMNALPFTAATSVERLQQRRVA
jgi:hypothetical protein